MSRLTPPRPWTPLSDEAWAALLPYVLPRAPQGRRIADLRARMDALFHLAPTPNDPWRTLPPEYGNPQTVARFFRRLTHAGLWHRLLRPCTTPPPTTPSAASSTPSAAPPAARPASVACPSFSSSAGSASAAPSTPRPGSSPTRICPKSSRGPRTPASNPPAPPSRPRKLTSSRSPPSRNRPRPQAHPRLGQECVAVTAPPAPPLDAPPPDGLHAPVAFPRGIGTKTTAMTSSNDVRATFLDYFARNGHAVVDSSPLVPRNDPTLLFTNSGMVQFKNVFTGAERRPYTRATTAQKCVRAGGKHNDLDNVGYTARHHTFFEMLGNFSFGDYFKEQAINHAWTLLTKDFALPKDQLLVTVYSEDEDAAALWQQDRRACPTARSSASPPPTTSGAWATPAPAAPAPRSSTTTARRSPAAPPAARTRTATASSRSGTSSSCSTWRSRPAPAAPCRAPRIDTGMGMERFTAILQGVHDNYDTDTFRAIILASAEATGQEADGPFKASHRVVADHLRSGAFLIAEGVLPSNEGRGYVLRRILRRAMRHAHMMGARDPLLPRLVPVLNRQMGAAYPELVRAEALDHRDAAPRGNPLPATCSSAAWACWPRKPRSSATASPSRATSPSASTTPSASRSTSPRTRSAPRAARSTPPASRPPWPSSAAAPAPPGPAPARPPPNPSGSTSRSSLGTGTEFQGYDDRARRGLHPRPRRGRPGSAVRARGRRGLGRPQPDPLLRRESGGQVGDTGLITADGLADRRPRHPEEARPLRPPRHRRRRAPPRTGAAVLAEVDHHRRSAIRAHH